MGKMVSLVAVAAAAAVIPLLVANGAAAATVASPAGTTCSTFFCLTITGNASAYTADAFTRTPFFGYLRLIGPGVNVTSPIMWNPSVTADGHGAGTLCATGLRENSNGTFTQLGLLCAEIS